MKKATKIIAVLVAAVLLLSSLAGCAGLEKQIIGTWKDSGSSTAIEFKEDGGVTLDMGSVSVLGMSVGGAVDGSYTLNTEADPATITISPNLPLVKIDIVFSVTYDDGVLTLTNSEYGLSYSMTKVED